MKRVLMGLSKIAGIMLIALAFFQWATFDYPDVNPFWPGAIFTTGIIAQLINWLIVCVLAGAGFILFSMGTPPPVQTTESTDNTDEK